MKGIFSSILIIAGFILSYNICFSENNDYLNVQKMRETITDWMNAPYLWGGNNKKGVDCSGFTKAVFKAQSIEIPRASMLQAKVGKEIDKRNLMFGDLIYFHKPFSNTINHVGICIGGNKFVHSSPKKGVIISSLNSVGYRFTYAGARRLLESMDVSEHIDEVKNKRSNIEKNTNLTYAEQKTDVSFSNNNKKSVYDEYYNNLFQAAEIYLIK